MKWSVRGQLVNILVNCGLSREKFTDMTDDELLKYVATYFGQAIHETGWHKDWLDEEENWKNYQKRVLMEAIEE